MPTPTHLNNYQRIGADANLAAKEFQQDRNAFVTARTFVEADTVAEGTIGNPNFIARSKARSLRELYKSVCVFARL